MEPANCPFCFPEDNAIVFSNRLWYARWDAFPATQGHLLIIPFRHVTGYFDLYLDEKGTLPEMFEKGKEFLDQQYSPSGYNIVINCGCAADQKVLHCHVHLIPRYPDGREPVSGGIRGFIIERPEKVA